jgi:hypothetical protein
MLVFGSILPGLAVAGEADSEGEGTAPPIEVPVAPPDFDPGGEESGFEEEGSDPGGEEESAPIETETTVPTEVPSAAPEAMIEAPPPAQVPVPEPAPEPAPAPAPEPAAQKAAGPSEPVANQSITAPKQEKAADSSASSSADTAEAPPAEESPAPSPPPGAAPPSDPGRILGGKEYVVRPGDCLWHIAAAVLPTGSDVQAIGEKVTELWRMNEDRIGTEDPNLIYAGTVLILG